MKIPVFLALSLGTLALVPVADAWPPVCIEHGAELGVVNAGTIVNCGVHAWAEVCVDGCERVGV